MFFFFFSSRRRHTRWPRDWSSDVCSSDLVAHAAREDLLEPIALGLVRMPVAVRVMSDRGGDGLELALEAVLVERSTRDDPRGGVDREPGGARPGGLVVEDAVPDV